MLNNPFQCLQEFPLSNRRGRFYSLPQLEKAGVGAVSHLPVCIRILLESVLRNCDGQKIKEEDVVRLANWQPQAARTEEIPFYVARILLQDFTGVPLLVDLAAMRSAAVKLGKPASIIEPLVPVDLIIDHSNQVDFYGTSEALQQNMEIEFKRNHARYRFLKWGMQAFRGFNIIPPGVGICHQVNLEFLAQVVREKDGVYFPDTLVGTDSHTPMINGLGVLGWGVGGIEAESGMLGQPVYFLAPDVVGVRISGKLPAGATATDLVLTLTEMLRKTRVVGKFVEFFGPGVSALSVPDRATLSNMAPEYGATAGLFPVDEMTCAYLLNTGRPPELVETVRNYYAAQHMFGCQSSIEYSTVLELNLNEIEPCVSGPKRPQDRIPVRNLKEVFRNLLAKPVAEGGYGKHAEEMNAHYPVAAKTGGLSDGSGECLRNGSAAIAAITSCTNTSNPSVMIAAGLLAKNAVEKGLAPPSYVKTSLAPGSRVVSHYLEKAGLQQYLDRLGFQTVGYGCSTCIGNSGPLATGIEEQIVQHDLVLAGVLSGNRNFEARIHPSIRANFLMSPPLVVAYALAGRADIDLLHEPLGKDESGRDVYLKDIWPQEAEIQALMDAAWDAESCRNIYDRCCDQNPYWQNIPSADGQLCQWDKDSTYIQDPPYFEKFSAVPGNISDILGMRPLAILGDSITTDHISPAGAIRPESPAGLYLQSKKIPPASFNTYGARRGNHEVMMRGTFANVRIRNKMTPGIEGGATIHYPSHERMSIYDAAMRYKEAKTPLVIFGGLEYGSGSSRDWAAKGTSLLGVKAVIAQSFERIHRSNLVGMGVLPCQFKEGMSAASLHLDGSEQFDVTGIADNPAPRQDAMLVIRRAGGRVDSAPVAVRIDTPIEVEYYRNGGILPFVLRKLI